MRKKIKEKLRKTNLSEKEFKEFLRVVGVRRKAANEAMKRYRAERQAQPNLPDRRVKIKER
jgi:hypothetical protein